MKKIFFSKGFIAFFTVCMGLLMASCTPDNLTENEGGNKNKLTVCGYVYNSETGGTIEGAKVDIKDFGYDISSYYGAYEFYNVPEGTYRVEVSNRGYNTLSMNITISADEDPVYWYKDFYLTKRSGDSGNGSSSSDDNNNDNTGNDDSNDSYVEEDYSSAEVSTDLSNLDVNLVSCYRKGDNVELTYTLTNTSSYGNMNITINNVNAFTQKTFVSDDLGNQYSNKYVKIALGGKDWGYGNNIEGTLLTDIPSKCIITVKDVDKSAKYMTFYMYTSTALPGSVNYSADVVLKNVKIH